MNRILTLMTLMITGLTTVAQTADSISMGAGYANDVFYKLDGGQEHMASTTNWDLAFAVPGFSTTIRINSAQDVKVWLYPKGDTSAWSSMDTTGLSTWGSLYNSDTSWFWGALDQTTNKTNPFDVGWGLYNLTTHQVHGDSIYVIQASDGSFHKLWIESLIGTEYTIRLADLNGNNDHTRTLDRAQYADKNFGYFSIVNDQTVDREPLHDDWDLVFTRYITFIPTPAPTAYLVAGVLHNDGLEAVKVHPVNDPATYTDYQSQTFSGLINTIGFDWKTFNMTTFEYEIEDSLVYFVKDVPGNIWKVWFTGFEGTATGDVSFNKELLQSVGVDEAAAPALLNVYPNPVTGDQVYVTLDLQSETELTLTNLNGQVLEHKVLDGIMGMQTHAIDTGDLPSSIYLLRVSDRTGSSTSKLVIP